MIPKVIHYCWFGKGDKSKLAYKCINSWKKFFPDYEIREWNEDTFDISMNAYVKYMYKNKRYAYLSDYARLWVIYTFGGIYFDLDVEVIKSFDDIIQEGAFLGFENDKYINTGIGFGAEKNNQIIGFLLDKYNRISEDEFEKSINCPILNTEALIDNDIIQNGKVIDESRITIYPKDYFSPYDNNTASLKYKTDRTHSIHWYAKSWMSRKKVIISKVSAPFHRVFGEDCFYKIKRILLHDKESISQ